MEIALKLLDKLWAQTSVFADGLQADSDSLGDVAEIAYIEGLIEGHRSSEGGVLYTVNIKTYSIDQLEKRLVELKQSYSL